MKPENSIKKKSIVKWKVQTRKAGLGIGSTKQVRTTYKVNQEKIIKYLKNFCQQCM